jgi:hypothetical protein
MTLKQVAEKTGGTANHIGDIELNHTQLDDKLAYVRALVEAVGGTFHLSFPGEAE